MEEILQFENYDWSESKENCINYNSHTLQELYQWVEEVHEKHVRMVQRFESKCLFEAVTLNIIEEDEDEDTYRRRTPALIPKIQSTIQKTLQGDIRIIENLAKQIEKVTKFIEQNNITQEKDEIKLQQEELSKIRKDKVILEEKYNKLSVNLKEINDAMSLLEATNGELLKRVEALERANNLLEKKSKRLKTEIQLKNAALDKAEKIIKELYTKCGALEVKKQNLESKNPLKIHKEVMTDEYISIKERCLIAKVEELEESLVKVKDANQIKDFEISQLKSEFIKMRDEYETTFKALKEEASHTKKSLFVPHSPFREMTPSPKPNCEIVTTLRKPELELKAPTSIGSPALSILKETISQVNDPLVLLLISNLEQYASIGYERQKSTEVITQLNAYEEQIQSLIQLVKDIEKNEVNSYKGRQEVFKLLSETFHMIEQYNNQILALRTCLSNQRQIINSLNAENEELKEQVNLNANIKGELNKIKEELNKSNKICDEYEDKYNTEINKFKEINYLLGDSISIKESIKQLLESDRRCKELILELDQCQNKINFQVEKSKKDAKNLELMDSVVLNKERLIIKLRNELNSSNKLLEDYKLQLREASDCIKRLETDIIVHSKDILCSKNELKKEGSEQQASNLKVEELKKYEKQFRDKDILIAELRNKQITSLNEISTLRKLLLEKNNTCDKCIELKEQVVELDKKQKKYRDKLQKRLKEFDIIMTYIQSLLGDIPEHKEIIDFVQKVSSRSEEFRRWFSNIELIISTLKERKRQYDELMKVIVSILEEATKKQFNVHYTKEIIEELQRYFKLHKKCYLPINYQ